MREMIRRSKTAKSCDGKSSVSKLAARRQGQVQKAGHDHISRVRSTCHCSIDKWQSQTDSFRSQKTLLGKETLFFCLFVYGRVTCAPDKWKVTCVFKGKHST